VEKEVRRFTNFKDAEKADRDFYRKLSGNERLQICIELSAPEVDQPMERVVRIRKFSDLSDAAP
jgi:hypothetical protein